MKLDEKRTFKLNEITKLFDIKRHFVIHLVEMGIITPLFDVRGRGKSRIYSYKNLLEIGIFIYLTHLRLSYEIARYILGQMSEFLKGYSKSDSFVTPYICVLGFLDGKSKIHFSFDVRRDTLSPQDFLSRLIQEEIKNKDIKLSDFAYYFIIDIKNIRYLIDSKIS